MLSFISGRKKKSPINVGVKKYIKITRTPLCDVFLLYLSIIISSILKIVDKAGKGVGVKITLVLLFAVLFVFAQTSSAAWDVVIDKVFYDPQGADNKLAESSYEMVEIKNISEQPVVVNDWEIRVGTYYVLSEILAPLPAGGSIVIFLGTGINRNLDFSQGDIAYLYRNKDSSQLPDTKGDIALYKSTTNNSSTIVDYVAYGKDFKFSDSTNFAHANSKALWKLNDLAPLAGDGCSIELAAKNKGDSTDWLANCAAQSKELIKNEVSVTTGNQSITLSKLTMDENIYENVYANFEIQKNADEKVTWTFGDGHKSYLAKTKHKFDLVGIYDASVRVYKGKINAIQNFTIIVESFPHPKMRIVGISANPKGSDTKSETITIENKSKKKINLKGWSVATGWKKFINHPIREDFEIKPGKEKELVRDVCSFTLNNDKNKIQLRYPDGEVADDMKYKSPNKSIAEGEMYQKVKGGWEWVASATSQKSIKSVKSIKQEDAVSKQKTLTKIQETNNDQDTITNNKNNTDTESMVENKLLAINNDLVKIELLKSNSRMLDTQAVREVDGIYFLTPQVEQQHYVTVFFKNISSDINSKLNMLLNYFFK